jgi:formylglycine-generating enzyme required for sulfatase activity
MKNRRRCCRFFCYSAKEKVEMRASLFFVKAILILAALQSSTGFLVAQSPTVVTNSIGMELHLIPKGAFTMGSPTEEEGAGNDEEQHQVSISKDYYLATTEVTQGQYEMVMGTNPSYFQKRAILKSDSSTYPVECISWDDAMEFCSRLSAISEEKQAGRVYRLPTEAEWEYALRAGSKTAFSFGESPELLYDYAWFDGNSDNQTHPVGEKKPNAWGLYDMHGNVWEWCADWHGAYPKGAVTDPVGPRQGVYRVYRGGGWFDSAADCRSALRRRSHPSDRKDFFVGFRVALSSSGSSK